MQDERTKSAFLSKARHNLKNPVNAILGFSEILLEDCEEHNHSEPLAKLKLLHKAGEEILYQIETCLNASQDSILYKSVIEMGKEIENAIRDPINDIVKITNSIVISDKIKSDIANFSEDIEKIGKSASLLEEELESIIHFNTYETDDLRQKISNTGHYTMIQDVIDSIEPINANDKKEIAIGNILVVDDNPNNTELLRKRLIKKGHQVDVANDGASALMFIMKNINALDLLILDIVMPKMNGFEVLKFIRNDKRFYDLPVIMISSMDDTDSIYRCIENGADDYIRKPFRQIILEARIDNCIEKKLLRDKEKELIYNLKREREHSERLLYNILPDQVAARLKAGEKTIADKHNDVTVIFADLINFTPQVKDLEADKVVTLLNNIFYEFDTLAQKLNIVKIKTIGDSYFAIGGLKLNAKESALNTVEFGKEIIKHIKNLNEKTDFMKLELRVGIHSGPAISGVIGKKKYAYDIWGSTVNLANRLETTCPVGKIQISEKTKNLVDSHYKNLNAEKKVIKGIGEIKTYTISI